VPEQSQDNKALQDILKELKELKSSNKRQEERGNDSHEMAIAAGMFATLALIATLGQFFLSLFSTDDSIPRLMGYTMTAILLVSLFYVARVLRKMRRK